MISRQRAAISATWRLTWRHTQPALVTLLLGIGIPSVIVFGGNGMSPRDLLLAMHQAWALRVVLWSFYFVLALSAARAAWRPPELAYMRSLPVSTTEIALGQLPVLFLIEAPWLALHAAGGGALVGIIAFAGMFALHAGVALAPSLRREQKRLVRVTLIGAWRRVLWRTRSELFVRLFLLWGLAVFLVMTTNASPFHEVQFGCTVTLWWIGLAVSPLVVALEGIAAKEAWVATTRPAWGARLCIVILVCVFGAAFFREMAMLVAVIAGAVLWAMQFFFETTAPRNSALRMIGVLAFLGIGTTLIWL